LGWVNIAICLAAYNIYILYINALIASFGSSAGRVLGLSVIITAKYRKIKKFCQGLEEIFPIPLAEVLLFLFSHPSS
jgi:hypothetical protein